MQEKTHGYVQMVQARRRGTTDRERANATAQQEANRSASGHTWFKGKGSGREYTGTKQGPHTTGDPSGNQAGGCGSSRRALPPTSGARSAASLQSSLDPSPSSPPALSQRPAASSCCRPPGLASFVSGRAAPAPWFVEGLMGATRGDGDDVWQWKRVHVRMARVQMQMSTGEQKAWQCARQGSRQGIRVRTC